MAQQGGGGGASSMFASLKQRVTEKINDLKPLDAADKGINDLVERATAELLIGPDWEANLRLVDAINKNPSIVTGKSLRMLKRSLVKPNPKTQLLTLTLIETCVKNCGTSFATALSTSDLFDEMLRMAADTGPSRVDMDVRDKALCLVEDFSQGLPQKEFRDAYESLLEQGVDFPVRNAGEHIPISTPPAAAYQPPPVVSEGQQVAIAPGNAVVVDPFAGMSEEDRAAVQAAMAEMAEEDRAAQEAARVVAMADDLQRRMASGEAPGGGGAHDPAAATAGAAAGGVPGAAEPGTEQQQQQQAAHVAPAVPEDVQATLQMMTNLGELLTELLGCVPEDEPGQVYQPIILELGDQAVRARSQLEYMINNLTDEGQLAASLSQHEVLNALLMRYEALLAKAEGTPQALAARRVRAQRHHHHHHPQQQQQQYAPPQQQQYYGSGGYAALPQQHSGGGALPQQPSGLATFGSKLETMWHGLKARGEEALVQARARAQALAQSAGNASGGAFGIGGSHQHHHHPLAGERSGGEAAPLLAGGDSGDFGSAVPVSLPSPHRHRDHPSPAQFTLGDEDDNEEGTLLASRRVAPPVPPPRPPLSSHASASPAVAHAAVAPVAAPVAAAAAGAATGAAGGDLLIDLAEGAAAPAASHPAAAQDGGDLLAGLTLQEPQPPPLPSSTPAP